MHAVSLPAAPARHAASLAVLARIAAVAAGYYLCGRLGLLLAIPPGYATAVWPPSGIALAAVLLWGPRVLPGVWLGSFLVNVGTSLGPHTAASALVPAVVAGGAAAQAWLGRYLILRFVGYRNLLTQELDAARLLILGGPVACLLNATVRRQVQLHGSLPTENLRFSWFTWWVGDSIGVMLFAALVLIWAQRPAAVWRGRQLHASLPLVAMFSLVVAVFAYTSSRAASLEAWSILAGGALFTSLLGMFLLAIVGRGARVEELVAAQTQELRVANAALAEALRHSAALEQQAQHRAAQLAASNTELERFAYLASHDLRAPLRSIAGFSQLLRRHYGAGLDPEAADYLGAIHDSVLEMQSLVDALLELSTLKAAGLEQVEVELGEVLLRARQLLAQDIAGRRRRRRHRSGRLAAGARRRAAAAAPVPESDRQRAQVPQRGRGAENPRRRRAPRRRLALEFRRQRHRHTRRPARRGALRMFKRLHSQDRYPGAGMGLAICRRVAELHGGSIHASSEPGQGAVFHLLLPACGS